MQRQERRALRVKRELILIKQKCLQRPLSASLPQIFDAKLSPFLMGWHLPSPPGPTSQPSGEILSAATDSRGPLLPSCAGTGLGHARRHGRAASRLCAAGGPALSSSLLPSHAWGLPEAPGPGPSRSTRAGPFDVPSSEVTRGR